MDFFTLQDQIAESVVASIEPYLFAAEGFRPQRRVREDIDAWGFVMRAMPLIWTWAADDNETAVAWLKQATRIDPAYARANALLAWVFAQRLNIGWAPVQESRVLHWLLPALPSIRTPRMHGPVWLSDTFIPCRGGLNPPLKS